MRAKIGTVFDHLPPELWHSVIMPLMEVTDIVVVSMACCKAHALMHSSRTCVANEYAMREMSDGPGYNPLGGLRSWAMPSLSSSGYNAQPLFGNMHVDASPWLLRQLAMDGNSDPFWGVQTVRIDRVMDQMMDYGEERTVYLRDGTEISEEDFICIPGLFDGVECVELRGLHMLTRRHTFGNLHHLHIFYCNHLVDVSQLGGVHTLELDALPQVSDLSALGNVHTLMVYNCSMVTDVSALGGVRSLGFRDCNGITDVAPLASVTFLDLTGCENVQDVSMLGRVRDLNLGWCVGITDVSALSGVHRLDLSACINVTDTRMLGSVEELVL